MVHSSNNNTIVHAQIALDSHAYSIVSGSNCGIMHYANRECDVSPYRNDYAPITNVQFYKQLLLIKVNIQD